MTSSVYRPGIGIGVVELAARSAGWRRRWRQVDPTGPVDDDAQDAAGVLEVVEVEAEVGEDGRDSSWTRSHHAHGAPPPRVKRKAWAPPTPWTTTATQDGAILADPGHDPALSRHPPRPPRAPGRRGQYDAGDARRGCRARPRSSGRVPSGRWSTRTVTPSSAAGGPRRRRPPAPATAPGRTRSPPPRPPRRWWRRRRWRSRGPASRMPAGRPGWSSSRPGTPATTASTATADFDPSSRRTTVTMPWARSRGPTSMRTGTPRSSQSVTRRPKLCSVAASSWARMPAAAQLGGEPLGHLAGAVLAPHEHHDHLRRRQPWAASRRPLSSPWAMISPPIMRVLTPHDVCHTYSWLPGLRRELRPEDLGEVLPELVAGAHLQGLPVAHHRLAGEGVDGAGEALVGRLAAGQHGHGQHVHHEVGVDVVQDALGVGPGVVLGGVAGVALLPEELGGAQEQPGAELPPHHVGPLVQAASAGRGSSAPTWRSRC